MAQIGHETFHSSKTAAIPGVLGYPQKSVGLTYRRSLVQVQYRPLLSRVAGSKISDRYRDWFPISTYFSLTRGNGISVPQKTRLLTSPLPPSKNCCLMLDNSD